MKKKVLGLTLSAVLFALCVPFEAQQAKKVPRIGFLVPGSFATYSPRMTPFAQGFELRNKTLKHVYAAERAIYAYLGESSRA